jgi:hypothetical protein
MIGAYEPHRHESSNEGRQRGAAGPEIAVMRGLSERTVRRQWDKARIGLHGKVQAGR